MEFVGYTFTAHSSVCRTQDNAIRLLETFCEYEHVIYELIDQTLFKKEHTVAKTIRVQCKVEYTTEISKDTVSPYFKSGVAGSSTL